MNDYELFLKLMDEELSEDELFYLSLSHNNFNDIFKCSEYTKELRKEYPSIVYKGSNIVYNRITTYGYSKVKIRLCKDYYFTHISSFFINNMNEFWMEIYNGKYSVGNISNSEKLSIGFYDIKDAEKYKEYLSNKQK